ncbi:MAG TPA: 16S rRNA (cytidine(1402)-2'-O)-methyltransferase [Candidatus Aquabacterium excrementipullorum]|nr:16S rRNA (cytidine(1402)-2'-O)-methyltransferase [Candidatus Aquabacterium excrementipullorum]
MAAGSQQYPAGALYVVATPIGNLADLTLRAIHVLALADTVACEDTRMTQRLLQHLGLDKRLMAVHEHNENEAAQAVADALRAGQRVAYVSDAGTPGVSDPGARLVRAIRAAGPRVVPIPGASAPVTLVSAAGDVEAQGFTFAGFLPSKGGARREALAGLRRLPGAVVLFESPHRVEDLARELAAIDPFRLVTVGRELTKQFEDIDTVPAGDLVQWLAQPNRQRGEFALVWHAPASDAQASSDELPQAVQEVLATLSEHLPIKEAARLLAEATGQSRNRLYDQALAWRQARQNGDD